MLGSAIQKFLQRLRFPYLLILTVILLGVDLVIPDPIPFIDEALLALLAMVIGSIRSRREPEETIDPSDPSQP